MNFGEALEAAKSGARIWRERWNGKNMFVAYSPGSENLSADKFWSPANREWVEENGGSCDVEPCFTIKTTQNTISMGWRPTSADMLANDWFASPIG